MKLCIAQDPAADALLSESPLALVVGMLLDQQVPMESAFRGPAKLSERLGHLDPAKIAEMEPETFAAVMAQPPAVHRFPGSMGKRVQALCAVIADEYGSDAAAMWRDVDSGDALLRRLQSLPGFGKQKSQIFLALLGKQLGITPRGWAEAAGAYGEPDAFRSVADVVSGDTLLAVRAYKQEQKRAAKG